MVIDDEQKKAGDGVTGIKATYIRRKYLMSIIYAMEINAVSKYAGYMSISPHLDN